MAVSDRGNRVGDQLYFDAIGLPAGLGIDHATGRVSGTTAEPGAHTVTVSVSDGFGVAVARFEWVVESS